MAYTALTLPPDVQSQLFCSECANYLSVGPVVLSPEGDPICGRCPKPKVPTESLYNLLAENFLFRCVNFHAGCEKLLTVADTMAHEKECEKRKKYECSCCKYAGNGCQLLNHFGKLHANSLVKGRTIEEILSYQLKNYVESLVNMNPQDVRLFVSTVIKPFSICLNCKKQFGENVDKQKFFCTQYHILCNRCSNRVSRCPVCNVPSDFDNKTKLDAIVLECEWDGCFEKRNIFQYMAHKQLCQFRKYECPSGKCNYVGCLEDLKKHWHLNNLFMGNNIPYVGNNYAYYWLFLDSRDIFHIEFINSNGKNVLIIDEKNVISPYSFTLQEYYFWLGSIFMSHRPLASITSCMYKSGTDIYFKPNF